MMQPLFKNLFVSQHSAALMVTYVLRNNSSATFEFFVFLHDVQILSVCVCYDFIPASHSLIFFDPHVSSLDSD